MLTWAEIDLEAIKFNLNVIRNTVGSKTKIIGVVKANAYGHGATQVAKVLVDNHVSMLAVATLDEALELRKSGFTIPILILFNILPDQIAEAIQNRLTLSVSSLELAKAVAQRASKLRLTAKLQLKVDTGMGRIGVRYSEAVDLVKNIIRLENIELEGIYTHFATADEDEAEADKSYAWLQLRRFNRVASQVDKLGINLKKHCANSAAIFNLPQSHMDMVRPGLMLYGLYPSESISKQVKLKPALTWKTRVMHLKRSKAGDSISYGRTYVLPKATNIATLPVGYADGYSRHLSHKAEVLIRGLRAPLVGRICMDQVMCDVGHIRGVEIGDEVVLIGKQGACEITAEEFAQRADTINYEIVCGIGRRVRRIYKGEGRRAKYINKSAKCEVRNAK